MIVLARALMAVVAVCLGELLLLLLCFPLAAVGVLPDGRSGIEVPALLLIVGAAVIWLVAFVCLTVAGFEP